MKIKFDNWVSCCDGSSFELEMDCVPRIGEEILIEKKLFPSHYFEGSFIENPLIDECEDGMITTTVSTIQHRIKDGIHSVEINIDV